MKFFLWYILFPICCLSGCNSLKMVPYGINKYKGQVHTVYETETFFSEGMPSRDGMETFYGVWDDIYYNDEDKDPESSTSRVLYRLDKSGKVVEVFHLLPDAAVEYNSQYEYDTDKNYYHTVIHYKEGKVYSREVLEEDKPGYHLFRTYNPEDELTQETIYEWSGNKVTMSLYEENMLRLKITNLYRKGLVYKAISENQYSDSKTISLFTYNEMGDRIKEVEVQSDGTRQQTIYMYEYDSWGNWIQCATLLENATTPCFITQRTITYY